MRLNCPINSKNIDSFQVICQHAFNSHDYTAEYVQITQSNALNAQYYSHSVKTQK